MAQAEIRTQFNKKLQAFLDFVLLQYISDGVKELDQSKLTLLLQIKYRGSIHDATADLGSATTISKVFRGFQKYLYKSTAA